MICPNCGSELKPGASFCVSCGSPVSAPAPAPAPQQPVTITTEQVSQENFAKGCIGALIGALIGGAAIFLIGKAGFIASLSGFVLAFLTFFLYEKMGGGLSKKGLIVCLILILVVPYLAHRLVWANAYVDSFNEIFSTHGMDPLLGIRMINNTYGTDMQDNTLFEILGNLDKLLEIDGINEDFIGDLVKLYGFTILGGASLVASKFSKKKK